MKVLHSRAATFRALPPQGRLARIAPTLIAVALACSLGCPAGEGAPRAQRTSHVEASRQIPLLPAGRRRDRDEPRPPKRAQPAPEEPTAIVGDTAEMTSIIVEGSSQSVGGPNDGSVKGAVALPLQGPGFRFNPRRAPEARYGTVEMVQALVTAAAAVADSHEGSELTINDLGYREGGPIPHHGSHRAGRDVDVLFYLRGDAGQPVPSVGAPIDPEGRGTDYRDLADPSDDVPLHFDTERTWALVRTLIEQPSASPLQRIFVAEHLRDRLLRFARDTDTPEWVVERFAELTCQPSYPHDDHFHFRFFCAPDDIAEGCEDAAPIYPWRRAELRELAIRPRRHRPRADRPMAPVTTEEAARAEAGEVHPTVEQFLRRREAWMRAPHPGRRYCR